MSPARQPARPPARPANLAAFAAKMAASYKEKVSNGPPGVIVPTGSVAIDWLLRVGGVQTGRVFELLGPKDSAKSSLAISIMIQHLLMFPDRGVCYINMENTFAPKRATLMGLDCSDAAIASGRWTPLTPDHSEDVSDMARDAIDSGLVSCLVVDSVGAMESKRVLEKEADKAADDTLRNSKIITQLTKALSTKARQNKTTVVLVNQPRAPVGSMGPDVSAGPKAMQHSTTVKIEMRPKLGEDDRRMLRLEGEFDDMLVSHKVACRASRMKNGLPGRVQEPFVNRIATAEYGPPGFDDADSYLTLGTRLDIIRQGGSHYAFPDGQKVNGRIAAATYLRKNPDAVKAIREQINFDVPTDPLEDED